MRDLEKLQEIFSLIRNKIPKKPGVYLFSDQNGDVMYVGKSVNLRQRISSYFRTDVTKIEYRIREMVYNIGDVDFYETGSELLALLLEDALIKKCQPRYNVRQQQYLGYQYILLTEGRYPTCKMISHLDEPDRGRIFGPFKSSFLVKDLLWIIRRYLRLRSCEDTEPIRLSMNYEFGYCTGPCRKKISPDEYAQIVGRVVELLTGKGDYVVSKITEAMEKASEALQFEKAEELKERIDFCERFCSRQRFMHHFKEQRLTLCENGNVEVTYEFERGRLKNLQGVPSKAEGSRAILLNEVMESGEDPRFLLDRANIVYNWIHNRKNECEYTFSENDV